MGYTFTILYMLYFSLTAIGLLFLNCLLLLLTFPFDKNRRIIHLTSCFFAFQHAQNNPFWRPVFLGRERIKKNTAYVIVANHQSLTDIIMLYGLRVPYKWVSKETVFKVPVIGWNMVLNEYVRIKRGDMKSTKEMMQTCRDWLTKGVSILMFPEGTRSPDGRLQPFKLGPFKLSTDCKVPVVPIVIDGTTNIMAKNSVKLNWKAKVQIEVLEPVDPALFNYDHVEVAKHVHKLMKLKLAEMRAEQPELETDSLIEAEVEPVFVN